MNEYTRIKLKYFNENVLLMTPEKEKIYDYQDMLLNIRQYGDNNKGPDLISIIDSRIYGIKHFEFDSTKNSGKGSSYKKQLAKIDHIAYKEIENKIKVEKISPLVLEQDIKQYINNFKKAFTKHYSKIDSYLDNLNSDCSEFEKEIWFFIEDVTPLGNTYINRSGKPEQFQPMLSLELIELLEKSSKLKGIIIAVGNILYVYPNKKMKLIN